MAKFLDLEGLNYFWEKIKSWVQERFASKGELSLKQNTLVSGLNIKTLNNLSILGSGNISIQNAVNSVNGKTGDVVLNAEDVDALPSNTIIPTKTSDLLNDSNFITGYTETDPTVPSWAKQENKPTYDYSEILNTPTIPVVPTNVSAFNNDAGYLTQHLDISGKADKATTLSGYGITDAYTKNDIDAKVSSAYKAAGSVSSISNLGSLDVSHEGFVYNMSASFTTTSDFVEGSGITYPAGTNVVIVNSNTVQDPIYKYDVLAGFVDLLNYVQKSNTTGLLKNDGTVDTSTYLTQHQDISGKADKVSGSTNGNFAALDSNGNLTDSGSKASDFATSARAIPSGGNAGQVLKKVSATDYDVTWSNQSETLPSAYCSTAGSTAAKRANCSLYKATANQYLQVLIGSDNTSASALTLEVNSQGQKPIYINGEASSSTNYTLPGSTYIVFYDGTNYYFRTDGKIQGPSGTLYIKPSTGIPASDIASGVIPVQDVTVGGTSVVSSGTAVIPQEVFWATYGTTTAAEIDAAVAAGKIVACKKLFADNYSYTFYLTNYSLDSEYIYLFCASTISINFVRIKRTNSVWSDYIVNYENTVNKVTSISSSSTNTQYPSAKCVYDSLVVKQDKPTITTVSDSTLTQEIADNTIYNCSTALTALTITLPNAINDDFISEIDFTSGSTATTLTAPNTIFWAGDDLTSNVFVPAASKRYTVMFYSDGVNVRGVVQGFATT